MFWEKKKVYPVPTKSLVPMSLAFKGHFVQNSCHPFYAGFRKIARFHRYIGTCFLENLNSNDYRDVRCNRRSFYLIYLISLWSFILGK
ncbi:hypothetical protein IscW_ISCW003444 [Ixodes scapularis]|uniref:Uncharacterized protein n=1 Tax=Ixodes scapularis TaxID=6945 RepID=B7PA25_IXOSC|nr:hypothetical protein IscW_ISCW003444 [Ixodes scapularis]|eukprot:XP_002406083.1 hypothetical protein IscW_ISCW003444 [Ixodes scapularis]